MISKYCSYFNLTITPKFLLLFAIYLIFGSQISSQESSEESLQMIERLLSEERYKEAEEDIISILKINPVNPKAEFLLTKAWIGMGRQERAKGRNKEAKGFFKKALSNWPLNSELQKEYTQLEEKYPSYRHEPSNVKLDKETIDLLNSIQTDIAEIKEELKRNSNEPAYTRIYPYAIVILLLIAMIELIVIIRK